MDDNFLRVMSRNPTKPRICELKRFREIVKNGCLVGWVAENGFGAEHIYLCGMWQVLDQYAARREQKIEMAGME